jgi:predicted  nucleic acid-binding Zn-ribbon protein
MNLKFNIDALRQIKWQKVLFVVLALSFGLSILFGRSSVREAKKITKELELRIDTLKAVENEYVVLEKKYIDLYAEFSTSRKQISDFKEKLTKLTKAQNASVSKIKNELNDLILKYDTIDVSVLPDTLDLNSIRF